MGRKILLVSRTVTTLAVQCWLWSCNVPGKAACWRAEYSKRNKVWKNSRGCSLSAVNEIMKVKSLKIQLDSKGLDSNPDTGGMSFSRKWTPELISPTSLENQEKELATSKVQMTSLILDMFFHFLPRSRQTTTTQTCLTLSSISSLSKLPGESQQGRPDQLVEISKDLLLFLSSRKQIPGH